MDFTRRIAVTAVLAGTLTVPAVCTVPARAASTVPARAAPAPVRGTSVAGPVRPAPRAADRGDPALDVVAVSLTALASAGGLLIARRRPR
ncbi:hypothetical protein ACFV98_03880 [Streptomyces violascens]|uniref:hypothetical protein n=1 Tax=Streptomyces violascens TaxID=67381 RepID=UPI00364F79CA